MDNEIRDRVKEQIARKLWSHKWRDVEFGHTTGTPAYDVGWRRELQQCYDRADQILAIPGICIVDRDTELPETGCENMDGICSGDGNCRDDCWLEIPKAKKQAQQDMLKAGYVKEETE